MRLSNATGGEGIEHSAIARAQLAYVACLGWYPEVGAVKCDGPGSRIRTQIERAENGSI
jgi:hypothetical protein